ncbi:helix-hairpin-helix domain-containing protein [Caldibacillus debilis]|uniref:Competence protein ComEA helix-hairpin-helix repeat region n=1 Tax=Caldibacillus debilis GB1 TaxID=1339248 RepID=A0A420VBP1_9BACI|nr:helix-hairpin-helix domain-containing protein [Caldibacillus debilis]RKO61011.1 competence protein ComEA helix-hairpin-helix repeat region [Caldibacillus debilis GB1]
MEKFREKRWLLWLPPAAVLLFFLFRPEADIPWAPEPEAKSAPDALEAADAPDERGAAPDEAGDAGKEEPEGWKVDVKGAVKKPGVYTASRSDRVLDLIERAGGFAEDADREKINLAQKVADEMVIYVPKIGEEMPDFSGGTAGTGANGGEGGGAEKVNINTADESLLQTLPGIGPAKAKAIIEYREENGPFRSAEDIKNVSGIGEKTFEKIAGHISVK